MTASFLRLDVDMNWQPLSAIDRRCVLLNG